MLSGKQRSGGKMETLEFDALRARLSEVAPRKMIEAIERMVPLIVEKRSYLDVLNAGGVK
jgi:hypothetical protein